VATKADFTPDEWQKLLRAPFMAGLVVVAASPSGPIGVLKEMFAVGKVLAEAKSQGPANALVKALVADLGTPEGRGQASGSELSAKAPDALRSEALAGIRSITETVARKTSPEESEGFRRWLVAIGQRVAEAAKEGGFLGFGGTQVSEQETAALKDLAAAVNVKA
jgi:hypothetical protein